MSHYTGAKPPRCPVCDNALDGATSVESPDAQPDAGALSFCIYCTAYLQYQDQTTLIVMPQDLSIEADQLVMLDRIAAYWTQPQHRSSRRYEKTRPLAIPRGPEGWRAGVLFMNNVLFVSAQPFPKEKHAWRRARAACGAVGVQSGYVQDENGIWWIGVRFHLFDAWQTLAPIGPYISEQAAAADKERRLREVIKDMGALIIGRPDNAEPS